MAPISLSSDPKVLLVTDTALEYITTAYPNISCTYLNRLITVLESDYSARHFVEGNISQAYFIDKIWAGSDLRMFVLIYDQIPGYEVIWLFYLDPHEYNDPDIVTFDMQAKTKLQQLKSIITREEIEAYIESDRRVREHKLIQLKDEMC